jgi:phytoene dehydrogenase-like protein
VHLGGTLDEIAAGEAAVAAARHPERPYVLAVQPCAADPSRAPAGKHVLWAYCHVPNGSTVDMTTAIEDQVERFAPGFRDLILARAAHGTAAMEQHNPNLVGGDIAGGYSGLSQFFRRPVLSPRPWRTPLPGVYLCSASTPPGAGVHGPRSRTWPQAAERRSEARVRPDMKHGRLHYETRPTLGKIGARPAL